MKYSSDTCTVKINDVFSIRLSKMWAKPKDNPKIQKCV